jgi:hypothetical protein
MNAATRTRSVMDNVEELVDRYTAIWNEPDPDRRRQGVAQLWSEDAVQILEPPQEVREAAAGLEVTPTFQARGHRELEARVTRAYEEFVATAGNSFRPQDQGVRPQDHGTRLADVVTWRWEMVTNTGEVAGGGLEFVVLAADGRIQTDYQFIGT